MDSSINNTTKGSRKYIKDQLFRERHLFTTEPDIDAGFDLSDLEELAQEAPWDVEKDKSSYISIIPDCSLIKKTKFRALDSTIYELFSTVLFSELCRLYNEEFRNKDFCLYSPESLRVRYKFSESRDKSMSEITQFLCPGRPFNKMIKDRKKNYLVNGEMAFMGERINYLAGIFSEISLREGIYHGDPHLRHFFLLPRNRDVLYIDGNENVVKGFDKNGIGIIDVENMVKTKPYSQEVYEDVKKLKDRVSGRFKTNKDDCAFDKGKYVVEKMDPKLKFFDNAYELTMDKLRKRFFIRDLDIETKKIEYIPKRELSKDHQKRKLQLSDLRYL